MCVETSLKSLDVDLIFARNWWLLPCWSAADTFPRARMKEKNRNRVVYDTSGHLFCFFCLREKKFEQKSLVSGWSPFTLLNRKVCRGGASRAANSACMICGIRIQIQHPSESDDQINKLGEKQTANSCSILFIESIKNLLWTKHFSTNCRRKVFSGQHVVYWQELSDIF